MIRPAAATPPCRPHRASRATEPKRSLVEEDEPGRRRRSTDRCAEAILSAAAGRAAGRSAVTSKGAPDSSSNPWQRSDGC